MSFERCLNCLAVIVTQGGTSIVLPVAPAERQAEAG
jgi:hypothetical protein